MRTKIALALCVGALIPVFASAQEAGQSGISMGYPGAIGFVYHVSDSVAVRPEVSFSRNTSRSSSTFAPSESSGWSTGVGASALLYFGKTDNVRPYFSPRFAYSRAQSTFVSSSNILGSAATSTTSSHGDAYSGTGSFGAQYTPTRRFGIFGEVGFGYSHTTSSGVASSKVTTNNWATRTAVGAIFYF
jgi:hypothetical protein